MRRTLNYSCKEGIGLVEFIRPERLNPLDLEAGEELNALLDELKEDGDLRCLVITGSGRAFSAGGDVKGMQRSIEEGSPEEYMDRLTRYLYDIALKLRSFHAPVVAAVNGLAVGAGMNLALYCDFIIASTEAAFSQGFSRLGLIPGFGGSHLLMHHLSWQKACEVAMLAEMIPAREMQNLGLVNRVADPANLKEEAMALAKKLAHGPALCFQRTKELFLKAQGRSLEDHLQEERRMQVASAGTDEYAEGVRALLARKMPDFRGPAKRG